VSAAISREPSCLLTCLPVCRVFGGGEALSTLVGYLTMLGSVSRRDGCAVKDDDGVDDVIVVVMATASAGGAAECRPVG